MTNSVSSWAPYLSVCSHLWLYSVLLIAITLRQSEFNDRGHAYCRTSVIARMLSKRSATIISADRTGKLLAENTYSWSLRMAFSNPFCILFIYTSPLPPSNNSLHTFLVQISFGTNVSISVCAHVKVVNLTHAENTNGQKETKRGNIINWHR